jgi:hypothetical protein
LSQLYVVLHSVDHAPRLKMCRIQSMVDQMTAMERVANTPIPASC